MHVSFDESNPSKEDKVVCDDDIVEVPIKDNIKYDEVIQQEKNQNYLPQ